MQRRCSNCTKDDETFGPNLNFEADAGPVGSWLGWELLEVLG